MDLIVDALVSMLVLLALIAAVKVIQLLLKPGLFTPHVARPQGAQPTDASDDPVGRDRLHSSPSASSFDTPITSTTTTVNTSVSCDGGGC